MPFKDREKQLDYFRRYNEENRARRSQQRVAIARTRRHTDPEYAERIRAYNRTRLRSMPAEVRRAHNAVARAKKAGRLVPADCCEECGTAGYVEAAHTDYSQPLDVKWLCRKCHRREDYRNPKTR